ncbi:MAG: hypothetical protein PHX74_06825, partial [Candidatus Sumerlaeales bacterium]|nr:hypothetical protein [Candidatus Sumerlaeales bacterium]
MSLSDSMDTTKFDKLENAKFIGMEFATWLCCLSQKNNGRIKLENLAPFDLFFESPIQFYSDIGDTTIAVLKGSLPIDSPEAYQALREGKTIAKAALRFIFQNQTYTLTLDAGRMLVSGLKVPMPANVSVDNYLDIRLERL